MFQLGSIEYVVIGFYLAILIATAILFRRFNSNVNDYFRNGCRALWWMVGTSSFMAMFSAWTFTGAASVAYEAGWSVSLIFVANAFGFLLQGVYFAPRMRQLRVLSGPEMIRKRFNVFTQQTYAYYSILKIVFSGINLYGVSVFTASTFGVDVQTMIVVLGSIVLFYSFLGGSWAVQATDFLQCLLVIPISILMAILAVNYAGGLESLTSHIEAAGLSSAYSLINEADFIDRSIDFTYFWAGALLITRFIDFFSMAAGGAYYAAKDGKEASKGAFLAGAMMLIGVAVWFIPPMVSRIFFSAEVDAMALATPADASYAIAGVKLLPLGLVGVLVIAMFAASMSSLDTALNQTSAIFINDTYPRLCKIFKVRAWRDKKLFVLAQGVTFFGGVLIILSALIMSQMKGIGLFGLMQEVAATFTLPLAVPMVLAFFIRRTPPNSAIIAVAAGSIASIIGALAGSDFFSLIPGLDEPWKWHTRVFVTTVVGAVTYAVSWFAWKRSSRSDRERIGRFYEKMETPVDFAAEVGEPNDQMQYKIIGGLSLVIGSLLSLLLLLPNSWGFSGRGGIAMVAGLPLLCGLLMLFIARKKAAGDTAIKP